MSDATAKPKQSIQEQLAPVGHTLRRYVLVWFVLLLVGVYGFAIYRIITATNAEPSDSDISAQVQATTTPHVDPTTVQQLQSLQDHSVNVKTLFDQARTNPFHE